MLNILVPEKPFYYSCFILLIAGPAIWLVVRMVLLVFQGYAKGADTVAGYSRRNELHDFFVRSRRYDEYILSESEAEIVVDICRWAKEDREAMKTLPESDLLSLAEKPPGPLLRHLDRATYYRNSVRWEKAITELICRLKTGAASDNLKAKHSVRSLETMRDNPR